MPRLIKALDIIEAIQRRATTDDPAKKRAYRDVLWDIAHTPTIDAEPVRHGRWEHGMRCSGCGQVDTTKPNYCPNCGTKMDAKDNDVPTKPEAHRPEDCVNYATRQRDGRAVCLGTRELDTCDGVGCKRWKAKKNGGAEDED